MTPFTRFAPIRELDTMHPRPWFVPVLAAAVVSGCGGGSDADAAPPVPPPADGEVTFVGTGAIAWAQEQVEAVVVDGQLDVTIVCEGAVPHNLLIESVAGEEELVRCEGDDRASTTISVEPGTYDFWCSIPGHRAAGMEGVLTVE